MIMTKDYSDFDVISFLEDEEIYHRFSGDNVGAGWVGFECPFCAGAKEHCGVSLSHKCFSCFQCGEKGSPVKLIRQILNCSWAHAYEIIKKYSSVSGKPDPIPCLPGKKAVELPPLRSSLTGPGGRYLRQRGFDPEFIETKYGVTETGPIGDYPYRLVIPIYMNNKLVSFTTRDYTGKNEPKYKAQSPKDSVIPVRDCLYNIDTVTDKVLIVEGPADVWRMGDDAVALFGVSLSKKQQEILFHLAVHFGTLKKVVILLDPGAEKPADRIYHTLSSFIKDIKIVELLGSDPAELTQQDAYNLKLQIL